MESFFVAVDIEYAISDPAAFWTRKQLDALRLVELKHVPVVAIRTFFTSAFLL